MRLSALPPILLVVGLLSLVGCGSDEGDSDDGGAQATESAARFEGEERAVAQLLEDEEQANNAKDATKMCDLYSRSSIAYDCTANAEELLQTRGTMERTITSVTVAEDRSSAEAEAETTYSASPGKTTTENIHVESDGDKWEIVTFATETPAG